MIDEATKIKISEYASRIAGKDIEFEKINYLSSIQKSRLSSLLESEGINFEDLDAQFSSQLVDRKINNLEHNVTNYDKNFGLGLDVQLISELGIKASSDLKTNKEFKSIFTSTEIAYAEAKVNTIETLAGIFAAKEAILKSGYFTARPSLNEIEISHDQDGSPYFNNFKISISHSGDYAIAIAIFFLDLSEFYSVNNLKSSKYSLLPQRVTPIIVILFGLNLFILSLLIWL